MRISLIIPCYNETANIHKGVIDKIKEYVSQDSRFCEVIIVDDGSTDQSVQIIESQYSSVFPLLRIIKCAHQGKAGSIIEGIRQAKGEYVFFSDMDLATPITEAGILIQQAEKGYDVVIGSRQASREGAPLARKVMAMGMILVRKCVIGIQTIHDTQCGFKLFRTQSASRIIEHLQVFRHRRNTEGSSVSAGFDLEFLFLAQRLGYKIKEMPVQWRHVETKRVTFFSSSLEALRDIALIKWFDITDAYPHS